MQVQGPNADMGIRYPDASMGIRHPVPAWEFAIQMPACTYIYCMLYVQLPMPTKQSTTVAAVCVESRLDGSSGIPSVGNVEWGNVTR